MNLRTAGVVDVGNWKWFQNPNAWRRVSVTLAVIIVYLCGRLVPLPITFAPPDPFKGGAIMHLWASAPFPLSRWSIFALGMSPLAVVLSFFELARSFVPPFRRWTLKEAAAVRLNVAIPVLILIFALIQATAQTAIFERNNFFPKDSHWLLWVVNIATGVAATALLIWFCNIIDQYGLGNGFWLLFYTPALANKPFAAQYLGDLLGQQDWKAIAFFIAAFCVAIALIVIAWTATYRPVKRTGLALGTRPKMDARRFEVTPDLWVPYLAQVFPGTLLTLLYYIFGSALFEFINRFMSFGTLYSMMSIFFILVFTRLHQRKTAEKSASVSSLSAFNVWLFALVQIIIFAGVTMIEDRYSLPHILSPASIVLIIILTLNYRAVFLRS
ncbi:hypothetical protein [Methylovirgula sp. 4M-Z18]|uniref:hypothetical protein n=1 Tax=Methylovirgula sp. 4M-Z18 TaxID=2293567 RepID=UPI001313F2AA|nr:hypothetical protein [Methylovirgula sp. 4M-Z18]